MRQSGSARFKSGLLEEEILPGIRQGRKGQREGSEKEESDQGEGLHLDKHRVSLIASHTRRRAIGRQDQLRPIWLSRLEVRPRFDTRNMKETYESFQEASNCRSVALRRNKHEVERSMYSS